MRTLLGAAMLVLVLVTAARADEVVLTSGRTFVGRVVEETDTVVVIEARGGKLRFDRAQVKEVRRGPVPESATPAPAPAPSSKAPPASGSGAKDKRAAKRPKDLRAAAAELQAIRLVPWRPNESPRVTEQNAKAYKVVGAGNAVRFSDDRPASPDGIAELWTMRQITAGPMVLFENGRPAYEWVRLHWHEARREWLVLDSAETTYQRHCALVDQIVYGISSAHDENARIACAISIQAICSQRGGGGRAAPRAEAEKLRANSAKAAGSAAAGDVLYRIHQLEVEMRLAKDVPAHIAHEEERGRLARQLVDLAGR